MRISGYRQLLHDARESLLARAGPVERERLIGMLGGGVVSGGGKRAGGVEKRGEVHQSVPSPPVSSAGV